MELICYPTNKNPPKVVPGTSKRPWMDATGKHFAYRCIPLTIANASGWEILSPYSFIAIWNGGPEKSDILVEGDTEVQHWVQSHFGFGILTFHTGYLFSTSPGWGLWVRGSPNVAKFGIVALDALVSTDWLPMPFTMNWRFLVPGTIRFEKDEPFCFITPVPHSQLDEIEPTIRSLDSNPELKNAYEGWRDSRAEFIARLNEREKTAVEEGWQRHYLKGEAPTGERPFYHITKRKLKTPQGPIY